MGSFFKLSQVEKGGVMVTGSRIKYYRMKSELTQEELCRGICSPSYLSKVENNNMEPSDEILRLLCERMGISPTVVVEEDIKLLEKKLDDWYDKMKRDCSTVKSTYDEIAKQFHHIQSPYLSSKYELFQIKYFLITNQYETILQHIKELDRFQAFLSTELLFYYHYFVGCAYYYMNKLTESEQHLTLSLQKLQLIPKNKDLFQFELADVYYHLSLCHGKLCHTHRTRDFAFKSLEIVDKLLDYKKQIKLYIVLGINEGRIKNFKNSLDYYERALKIAKLSHLHHYLGNIHHNIGYLYSLQGRATDAIRYYLESLHYTPTDKAESLVSTYYCLAKEYKRLNQQENMQNMINKGMELLKKYPLQDYEYHYKMLYLTERDDLSSERNFIKHEVIPYFREKQQWNYVVEYAEILARHYEENILYKEASKYYKTAFLAQQKIQ